jgi:hypothetical protein
MPFYTGRAVFYDKKYVQTSKTKATITKPIILYYILSAGKPAPTISSDQGFYQSLWDNLDRENRFLKRTAPSAQANKASTTNQEGQGIVSCSNIISCINITVDL